MLTYPNINPIAFHLGPLSVHWYGIMYLIGFIGAWGLLSWRLRVAPPRGFLPEQVSDLIFYVALGIIIGGRLGYMIFYNFSETLQHPLHILAIWEGGMSFHGGLIGAIIAMWLFGRKIGKSLAEIADFVAPVVPIGLAAGRIGNFINGELWGRVTHVPWGMVFPNGGDLPRHPSQLYEFFLEGVVMFLILWFFSRKIRPRFAVSGLFLLLYGTFRFSIEFFREPDAQLGFVAFGWLTRGELLSIPMILLGGILLLWAYKRSATCNNT
jgi:phosphatidylglycerol:prolipoprotein diacylglycerol transferase